MSPRGRRSLLLAGVAVVAAAVVLILYHLPVLAVLRLELLSQDWRAQLGRKTAINTNLVFLGIDQPGYGDMFSAEEIRESPMLGHLSNWPFARNVYAAAINRLVEAGAKVVALDIVLAGAREGDAELATALAIHSNRVVIAANLSGEMGNVLITPDAELLGGSDPRLDSRVGFINIWPDRDGITRTARFKLTREDDAPLAPGEVIESLAARVLRKAGAAARLPSDSAPRLIRFSAPPRLGYPVVPFYAIFFKGQWEKNHQHGAFFRDKIVLIGPAASIMQDFHLVPLEGAEVDERTGEKTKDQVKMLGPEVHLNFMAAAMAGELLKETSPTGAAWMTVAAAFVAWLLAFIMRQPFRRVVLSALLAGTFCLLALWLFNRQGYVVAFFGPLLAFSSTSLGTFGYDFVLERREKIRNRRTLERYVSKDVVREILDNPDTYLNALGGVRRPVTILFSDIRGFTTLTEGADPAQLVTHLNEYFNEMVGIVFAEKGVLDKFIGDAVMALWGCLEKTSQGTGLDAQRAVSAALAMRKSLARLNTNWEQRGMTRLSFGIGINQGDVIVGNLGSDAKMEMSVIGDPVNLASRLEGLTKKYKLDLLLGESMVPLVQERFALRSVDSVQVSGKTKPVHVFTVVADKEAGEQSPAWLMRYEEGVAHYRARRFNDGLAAFVDCVRWQPEDYLSQLYLQRCQELVANPPGPDWDTVFVMKSK
jgi:adenylate cyclase